jgi:hypothetical protein
MNIDLLQALKLIYRIEYSNFSVNLLEGIEATQDFFPQNVRLGTIAGFREKKT